MTAKAGAPPPAQITSASSLGKSAPSTPPQQMNSFRSVFEPLSAPGHPAAHLQKRRYKLRWDWHLRNFLVSMIPPAALTVLALVYSSLHEEELKQLRSARAVEKKRIAEERDAKVEGLSGRVFDDLHALRSELEVVQSEVSRMRERDREKSPETGNAQASAENVEACVKAESGPGSAASTSAELVTRLKDPEDIAREDTSVSPAVAKDSKK